MPEIINVKYDYKPFGEKLSAAGNDRLSFINKEKDSESSLGDFGVRKYDEEIGRFTSIDPLFEKYYSLTPYQYSANNPVNAKDFNGKEVFAFNYMAMIDILNTVEPEYRPFIQFDNNGMIDKECIQETNIKPEHTTMFGLREVALSNKKVLVEPRTFVNAKHKSDDQDNTKSFKELNSPGFTLFTKENYKNYSSEQDVLYSKLPYTNIQYDQNNSPLYRAQVVGIELNVHFLQFCKDKIFLHDPNQLPGQMDDLDKMEENVDKNILDIYGVSK